MGLKDTRDKKDFAMNVDISRLIYEDEKVLYALLFREILAQMQIVLEKPIRDVNFVYNLTSLLHEVVDEINLRKEANCRVIGKNFRFIIEAMTVPIIALEVLYRRDDTVLKKYLSLVDEKYDQDGLAGAWKQRYSSIHATLLEFDGRLKMPEHFQDRNYEDVWDSITKSLFIPFKVIGVVVDYTDDTSFDLSKLCRSITEKV